LVEKPEGKRALGKPRRKLEDSIKMDLKVIGWGGMDVILLAQNKEQWGGLREHGNEPSGSIKC
jgi:hypothetical protein